MPQRSELVQPPWLVSGPRTFLRCCNFMSEHVQLNGLLPTDRAAQEQELLCRAIEFGLTHVQLQDAELSCFEILVRRLQMLEMKLHEKVAGFLLGGLMEEDSHTYLGTRRTGGLLMIAPELEEFASGVLAKDTAEVRFAGKGDSEERSGAPPAGGKKR